jgi:hypothetical protein
MARRIKAEAVEQTTIPNDGQWTEQQTVEVDVPATEEEQHVAAKSQADLSLKIQELLDTRARMNHDFNRKIKAAQGAAKTAALIVKNETKIVMVEAEVIFNPLTKVKTATDKATGNLLWRKPMTENELELGPPEGQSGGEGDEADGQAEL